jgi:hypothetical protein
VRFPAAKESRNVCQGRIQTISFTFILEPATAACRNAAFCCCRGPYASATSSLLDGGLTYPNASRSFEINTFGSMLLFRSMSRCLEDESYPAGVEVFLSISTRLLDGSRCHDVKRVN